MVRLPLLLAAAALTVLSLSSSARAETSSPPVVESEGPREAPSSLPKPILRVLGVLETVGVVEIDRSSVLISATGVEDTLRLPVRTPGWVAPEPPRMPLLFSRLVQVKFSSF